MKYEKIHYLLIMVVSVLNIFVWTPNITVVFAGDDDLTPEEREEKAEDAEEEKEKLEKKAKKVEQEKAVLQGQLGTVQQKLGATKRTIADVESDIESKERDIQRHDAQITTLNAQIMLYRRSLSEALRQAYYEHGSGVSVNAVMENDGTRRFMEKTDDLFGVRSRIADYVHHVDSAKNLQTQKKEELEELKNEKETLLAEHKQKESGLLAQSSAVQTEIVRVDATLQELNAKMAVVESKLSALLGKSFSTDDIVEAAKFASKKTGVRKDFILGMLVVETNLGSFTGGCTYKTSNMNETRKKYFKEICDDLDYDYKKQKVSCPPKNYKGTGGAMGVAQFMSDTWKGYESKIAAATGHNPPDPWDLTDGVMAMALKLANDGATKKSGEWKAASRYLGTCSTPSTKFYCEDVLYWADNYEKKL